MRPANGSLADSGVLKRELQAVGSRGHLGTARVYADTALAGTAEVMAYLENFGFERLLFGSDYPFGDPVSEKEKILSLDLPETANQAILADN